MLTIGMQRDIIKLKGEYYHVTAVFGTELSEHKR